jgi:hypothetical protein
MTAPFPPLTDPNGPVVQAVAEDVAMFLGLETTDNRQAAWHAVRTVYGLLGGALRSRVPVPLPDDLQAVLRAGAMRYALMLVRVLHTHPPASSDQPVPVNDGPSFLGFSPPESVVIARYRKRTA